jgi:hypothetical protein
VHTPPDDDGGADLLALEMRASGKRARQVRPAGGWPQDESEEEAGGPPSGGPARKKPRQPKPDRALVSAAGGTPGADSSPGPAAAPVGEWRNGFYFSVPHTEVIPGVMLCGRLGIPDAADAAEPAAPKKRRHRGKKSDEGDLPELKPRHLRGKRKEEADARTAHNASLSESRRAAAMLLPPPGDLPPAEAVEGALSRMLRPKTRRWCVYEWFESPVRATHYAPSATPLPYTPSRPAHSGPRNLQIIAVLPIGISLTHARRRCCVRQPPTVQ